MRTQPLDSLPSILPFVAMGSAPSTHNRGAPLTAESDSLMEKWTEVWTSFSSNRPKREALAEFFSDPSRWGDCRLQKENVNYPDFKHKKKMRQAVWVGDGRPAPWVAAELVAMAPRNGTTVVLLQQQLDIFAWKSLQDFSRLGNIRRQWSFINNCCNNIKVI